MVPKNGDPIRSKKYLDVAAGWYGLKVVPAARGGIFGGVGFSQLSPGNGVGWSFRNGSWYDKSGNLVGWSPAEDAPITWTPSFGADLSRFFASGVVNPSAGASAALTSVVPSSSVSSGLGSEEVKLLGQILDAVRGRPFISGPLVEVNPAQGMSETRIGEIAAERTARRLSASGVRR